MKLYKSIIILALMLLSLSSTATALAGHKVEKEQPSSKAPISIEFQENEAGGRSFVYKNPHSGKIEISGSVAAKDCIIKGASKEAQAVYDKARSNEPEITRDMVAIANKLGSYMHGLPYSVKTASSVADKIERGKAEDLRNGIERTDAQILESFEDLVRYTLMTKHDNIAKSTKKTMRILEKRHNTIYTLFNSYNDKSINYKGVHILAMNKNGQKFELQIHSEESMKAYEATHAMYEEARKVSCEPKRRASLMGR